METDGRRVRGQRTRDSVLDAAVELASVSGLDGLSLGKLAAHTGVSKSGLFTHWPDKERLQLDTVEWARRQWLDQVVQPALRAPRGVRRMFALHEARLAFYANRMLQGGCFFLAAKTEFDDRPGAVHDRVAEISNEWLGLVRSLVDAAIACGDLASGVNTAQLAYEIDALGEASVIHSRLIGPEPTFTHARRAVLDRLRSYATDPSILPED